MISAALQPLSAEAGGSVPAASDFARFSFLPLQYVSDLSADSYRVCGTHTVRFTLFGIPLETTLTVADTVPPFFVLQDAAILGGEDISAEDFIVQASDASAFTTEMSAQDDISQPGEHEITLTLTDAYGNSASGTAVLTVYGHTDSFTVEAGSSLTTLRSLIRKEIPDVRFAPSFSETDLTVPGTDSAEIIIDGQTFTVSLTVEDTVPPTAETKDVYTLLGRLPAADAFLRSVSDATSVTASYITEPDCTKTGWQKVFLRLTDAAGNTADISSYLRVYAIPSSAAMEAGVDQDTALDMLLAGETGCSLAQQYVFHSMPAGEHTITVTTPGGNFDIAVTLTDTTPPTADPLQVVIYLPSNTIPTPADFVDNIEDASAVTASFVGEVDFATPGESLVPIRLTDAEGNSTTINAYLTVVDDHMAPVITGVKNLSTYVNGRLSYKTGVTAEDEDGAPVTVTVDSSAVKLSTPGRYRITYYATDSAGNTSTATAYVTVEEITKDVIRPYAENILAKILKDGMTAREKARAIYDWMTANVSYVTYADKTYWMRAAYYGFTNGRGDCYVYYAMSRILLDCAGIENMEICRDNPTQPHYWNLINCGDGWYHFDTCPHYKQYPLTAFMLTDAEVEEYSQNKVKDYYSFDKSLYPATP